MSAIMPASARAARAFAAAALLVPATAAAGPREEVRAAAAKFMAARSWHATVAHSGPQPVRNTLDFNAPDRYRMVMPGMGAQTIVGDTAWMTIQGRTVKVPMPAGTMTGWRQSAQWTRALAEMTVTPQGTDTLDGRSARRYRLEARPPQAVAMTLWVGADGYPMQVATTGGAGAQRVTTTIRYARFNDPAIRIAVPR